jgi:hypothetical protein
MAQLAEAGAQQFGLFTFPNSPKHHALYQKFGFYPRFLTFVMAQPIQSVPQSLRGTRYSELALEERSHCLKQCAELTNAIYPGLDLSREIVAVHAQNLGNTRLYRK